MRHVSSEADGVEATLGEPELEQVPGTGRHLHSLHPGLVVGDQFLPRRVRCDADGAGVRHGHRYRIQADREPHAEVFDQADDGGDVALPLHVGLGPGEEQKAGPGCVGDRVKEQLGVGVAFPMVGVEDHRRTSGAVVVQLIDVEPADDLVAQRRPKVFVGEPDRLARVDEPVESVHEHRAVEDRHLWVERVQLARVEHVGPSSIIALLNSG